MTKESSTEQYNARFPKSRSLYERAKTDLPRGVTHDAWHATPFPIYITHAKGSRKWDEDGYEYVDYIGGHGALMLGHSHPSLIEAVNRQIGNGVHFGACHERQLAWAERIKDLVPSARIVEFTNSGTEANMLAIRLARAFTGRSKIIRFQGQFGGFSDNVMVGTSPPYDTAVSTGILPAVVENILVLPNNNEEALEQALAGEEIALVMIEAAGAFSGVTGVAPSFYERMRELTTRYGTLLHFDEVVTGFRYSPGGVQGAKGVTPDLTSLGKIVTGGMPGAGAIVGRPEVMEMMLFKDDEWNRYKRVSHTGTFNGNPLCAATGIATLDLLADGKHLEQANRTTRLIKQGLQAVMDDKGVSGCVYGDFSVFHIYFGDCGMTIGCDKEVCLNDDKERPVQLGKMLAMNMALHGVHLTTRGFDGIVSAVHDQADVDVTVKAFAKSVDTLIEEGLLKQG
jgi:glutamate-1-semialdehyde 2,1-aminomutase